MNEDSNEFLIGIVVDASSSMRRNWKNKNGKKLPKIEVIRDSLNEQFNKFSILYANDRRANNINFFCLGMGLQLPIKFAFVDTSNDREKIVDKEPVMTRSDVICDVIALAELLPTKSKLEQLRDNLNKMWLEYAEEILGSVDFDEDIYIKLQTYIHLHLRQSAITKSQASWRYRLRDWLDGHNNGFTNNLHSKMQSYIEYWNDKIEKSSLNESTRYIESIQKKSEEVFLEYQKTYIDYIDKTLNEFARSQVEQILKLIGLGFPIDELIRYFDKDKALELAKAIFGYLDKEVKKNMIANWNTNKVTLFITQKDIGASIDTKQVKLMTEKCIQKHGWDFLRKFVEQTVNDLFLKHFNEQVKLLLPHWIEIATHREVIRSIRDVGNILPEASTKDIYSKDFMFGSTPINMVMDRVALRFLDLYHSNKKKILLIITDGEFESLEPIASSDILKKMGVIIVGCYVGSSDMLKSLVSNWSATWPQGAKTLLRMSSEMNDIDADLRQQLQSHATATDNTRLFYQINQSQDLQELLSALIPDQSKWPRQK